MPFSYPRCFVSGRVARPSRSVRKKVSEQKTTWERWATCPQSLAAMGRAVGAEPAIRFDNLQFHVSALVSGDEEFRMVLPDQRHKSIRERLQRVHQTPAAVFQAFSFRAVFRR